MEPESPLARRRAAAAALMTGPAAVGLSLAAHLVSGGAAPPGPVLAALTVFASLLAAATALVRLPAWAIGIGSGAIQQALHLLFTALTGPNAPLFPSLGHVHGKPAVLPALGQAGPSSPADLHLMVVAHVVAALLTVLVAFAANRISERQPQRHSHLHEYTDSAHQELP